MEREYYTTEDVAQMLGVVPKTVRAWIRRGELRGVKIGKLYLVHRDTLDELRRKAQGATATKE